MWIDDELYERIKKLVPIPCVDCIIEYNNEFLLIKRATEPAKDVWWFVGGRQYINESLPECAVRKCKEEVGLDVEIIKQLGVQESVFDEIHTDNVVYHVRAKSRHVIVDHTISDYVWIDISDGWQDWYLEIAQNPYIIKCFRMLK